jgi:hypothetical protein
MIQFAKTVKPDADALIANLRRQGTPKRVHYMELFLDGEIQNAIIARYGIGAELDQADPYAGEKRQIALMRFLGYDYIHAGIGFDMPTKGMAAADTAALARTGGRKFMEEHKGPITN